jgi:hypothetical protein
VKQDIRHRTRPEVAPEGDDHADKRDKARDRARRGMRVVGRSVLVIQREVGKRARGAR